MTITLEGVAAVIIALTGLVAAGGSFLASLRNGRKIEQVHMIVNSRMTSVLARVEQLTEALKGSDTEVPDDPEPTT